MGRDIPPRAVLISPFRAIKETLDSTLGEAQVCYNCTFCCLVTRNLCTLRSYLLATFGCYAILGAPRTQSSSSVVGQHLKVGVSAALFPARPRAGGDDDELIKPGSVPVARPRQRRNKSAGHSLECRGREFLFFSVAARHTRPQAKTRSLSRAIRHTRPQAKTRSLSAR